MMKRNIYILSTCLVALVALAACTHEAFLPDTLPSSADLTITVVEEEYAPADLDGEQENRKAATRAEEIGNVTRFTDGDQIGMFVLSIDSLDRRMLLHENLCLTYDGKAWTSKDEKLSHISSEGNEIYYYAYYPYQANMTDIDKGATDSSGVKTTRASFFFQPLIKNWSPSDNQSTYSAYTASDLMIAGGELALSSTAGYTLTFTMQHQMALLILDFPSTKCTYTEIVEGEPQQKNYYLYTGISLPNRFWRDGPYSARTIIKPKSQFTSEVCTYYNSQFQKRRFRVANAQLSEGQLKHYAIDGGKEEEKQRPLQTGDFNMKDGTVVPQDAFTVMPDDVQNDVSNQVP